MEDRLLTLRLEDFEPLVGQTFIFRAPAGQEISTRLDHGSPLGGAAAAARRPFALIFTSEAPAVLEQQTVQAEHATLGSLEVFIVPVGPGAEGGMRYEAIFT